MLNSYMQALHYFFVENKLVGVFLISNCVPTAVWPVCCLQFIPFTIFHSNDNCRCSRTNNIKAQYIVEDVVCS